MTERERPLYDLLAGELADDWQPHSISLNRLSYQECQQLAGGPDPDFIKKQLAAARRGRKRASIAFGIGFAFIVMFPLTPFGFAEGDWTFFAGLLLGAVPLAVTGLAVSRHMHWRKREMIYLAFRLMSTDPDPNAYAEKPAVPA